MCFIIALDASLACFRRCSEHSLGQGDEIALYGVFQLKLIKNLSRRPSKNGNSMVSWGLFKCNVCGKEVERPLSNGKRAKKCGSPGCGGNFFMNKDEAIAGGGLIFIQDNGDGTALFRCPYCEFTIDRPKSKGKNQKSCGCSKWQTAPYKYWFRFSTSGSGPCNYCNGDGGDDIERGEYVWGMRIRGKWFVVHEGCFEYAREKGHWMMMDEIAAMKDERQRELTYLYIEQQQSEHRWARSLGRTRA